jgi:phosphatidylethanolamine-binding protein (PEBP) family uncharacterized protein
MEKLLKDNGIVEDCGLEVSGSLVEDFSCGHDGSHKSTPEMSAKAPSVSFAGAKAGMKYCLICTDPDAPSRAEPLFREFIHWVVSDVLSEKAETIVNYLGPGPPCNSGLHRYVFLLFEQPDTADVKSLAAAFDGRGGKKAFASAKAAGLGSLVAADFYEAEWDESVDAVHESIGFTPPERYMSPKQKANSSA